MAYDGATGQLVLFGGKDGVLLNDTWIWNGTVWVQQTPVTSPPASTASSMAYDAATQQLVLLVADTSGIGVSQTWTWDGSNWTQQHPTNSPSARYAASMAYDAATSQLVLFGGQTNETTLQDTWTWNGTNWIQLAPSVQPPPISFASMAYDPATSQLVLFGGATPTSVVAGATPSAVLADTWTWNGTTWTKQTPGEIPPARDGAAMAYDGARGELVLFGGLSGSAINLDDTWTWDGSTWTQVNALNSPARELASMDYDTATGQLVLFGGYNGIILSDSWVLQAASTNLGTANACPSGGTTPAPCSQSATISYSVAAGTTIGSIQVLTQGATGKDFQPTPSDSSSTLCQAQTYSSATICTVDVTFTPLSPGQRKGAVVIKNASGGVLATSYIYGTGIGPMVTFPPGMLSTVAGNGTAGSLGDNGVATSAELNGPQGIALDGSGNLYIADTLNNVVRKVDSSGTITTVAGAPVTAAIHPVDVAVDGAGNLYIADSTNEYVWKLSPSGTLTPAAGTGVSGNNGDGIAATTAKLASPSGVSVDGAGNLYIAEAVGARIRRVNAFGVISTVAGTGTGGYNGDSMAATNAELSNPLQAVRDDAGNLYIADYGNKRVRKVDSSGVITTVAGNGSNTYYTGNSVAATSVGLSGPISVAVNRAGEVFFTVSNSVRLLKVDTSGILSTVNSSLSGPWGLTIDLSGGLYIADQGGNLARKLDVSRGPSLSFASTLVGATSSAQTVTVANAGNATLAFPIPPMGSNPSISSGFTLDSTTSTACPQVTGTSTTAGTLDSGKNCTLAISFAPVAEGTVYGAVTLTDIALNQTTGNATQVVGLSGVATSHLTITTTTLPSLAVGAAYHQSLAVSGGTAPYIFLIQTGALPFGIILSADGVLSGTPTTAGPFSFTVQVYDSNSLTASQSYSGTVATSSLTMSPETLPNSTTGQSYSQTFTAGGGVAPYTYSLTGTLPTGITLSAAGVLSGTPTTTGQFSITVMAVDSSTAGGTPLQIQKTYSFNVSTTILTNAPTVGTNQVTLSLAAGASGTGYVELVPGTTNTCPLAPQIVAGLDSTGAPALQHGSLPLTANVLTSYTFRNLPGSTSLIACFTPDSLITSSQPFTTMAAATYSPEAWSSVGTPDISVSTAKYESMAFSPDGTPYVAYQDMSAAYRATVMRYTGGSWQSVGNVGFSTTQADFESLAFSPDGTPYLAYKDLTFSKATVKQFSAGAWHDLGSVGPSSGEADYESLAFGPDGTPYVAFEDRNNGGKATVMRYTGGAWQEVGSGGLSTGAAEYESLAFSPDGTPYIAYQDLANGEQLTVMRYTGGAWQPVGPVAFSPGTALLVSLSFAPDGTPYVAFEDNLNNNAATVMRYVAGAWQPVGPAGFSTDPVNAVSLTIGSDGTPYLAYVDLNSSGIWPAIVKRYTAGAWQTVGGIGAFPDTDTYLSLALSPDGTPYLASQDVANDGQATVTRLIQMPVPAITSISPVTGSTSGGTNVTITGTGFSRVTEVHFGTTDLTTGAFTVVNDSTITVDSPARDGGAVDITVTNAAGVSPVVAADRFTYLSIPTVTSISPDSGPSLGGTVVTITGTLFSPASTVTFGGVAAASTTYVNAGKILATSPALTSLTTVDVLVTNAAGISVPVAADIFHVGKVDPTITTLPTASALTYGQPVSSATLTGGSVMFGGSTIPGTFSWVHPDTVYSAGTYSVPILFIPTDFANYSTASGSVTVVVNVPNYVVNTVVQGDSIPAHCTPQVSPATNATDSACALSDALAAAAAPGGANITFSSATFASPQTITLDGRTLPIPSNTKVTGPTSGSGASLQNLVTVDAANNGSPAFLILFDVTGASISNLNVVNGSPGIENAGGLTVSNSTISNNSNPYVGGGGGISNTGTLTVIDSTISNNTAQAGNGGGVNSQGTATFIGDTIVGNTAPLGSGGGLSINGTATITHSTLTGNTVSASGADLYLDNATSVQMNNSIVFAQGGTLESITGSNNLAGSASEQLAALDNYGGPTKTMIPLPGSPAICAGSANTAATQGITSDQRGTAMSLTSGNAGTYTGVGGYCPAGSIDAGAVQTSYAISFSGQPSNVAPNVAMSPSPTVTVKESGSVFPLPVSVPLGLTSTPPGATLSGGSASTTAGVATYSNLRVDVAGTGDTLTASLPLNSALSTPALVRATSNAFTVTSAVTATVAIAAVNATQSQAVTAFTPVTGSGGTGALAYSVSPTLPGGLSMNSSTGAVSGTATAAHAQTTYTVTVIDASNATATAAFQLTVNGAVTVTRLITGKSLTQGIAAVSFIPATGSGGTGTLAYSVSPALPAGLLIDASTGAISGTPTVSRSAAAYTITVTDTNGATGWTSFALLVTPPVAATQAIATESLVYNTAANFKPVTGSNGTTPLTYSVSPSLPAGVSLDASTGTVSGTPTAAHAAVNYTITVTDANGSNAAAGFAITVNKATPSIATAPTAAGIAYGQTLASSVLTGGSATFNGNPVAGSFSWTTPATTPVAGTVSESITFTPTDTANYNSAAGNTNVTVGTTTPTIVTLPTASAITYGQPQSASTLTGGSATFNGSAVAGTFAWATPSVIPSAGTAVHTFTFTPTDTSAYSTVNGTTSLTVNKATPTITMAPTASAITYGQPQSASTLTGGSATLNSSTVAGTFAWATPSVVPSAGTAVHTITFTPTDAGNYTTVDGTTSLTVNKATQTITTAPTASAITYGQTLANATLSGGAATISGTPVPGVFTWTTPATVPPAGTTAQPITFTPTDAASFNSVTGTATVTVNKANATVTWAAPSSIVYGTALSAVQLNATASVSGSFVYSPAVGTVLQAGSHTLSATFTPTDGTSYSTPAAKTVNVVVTVAPLTITVDSTTRTYGAVNPVLTGTPSGLVNGDTAASVGVTYSTTATPSSAVGTYPITASITSTNYSLTATPGVLTITGASLTVAANNATKVFGTANPTFSGSVLGQQNGDSFSATYATTATVNSNVGTYAIVPSVTGANLTGYAVTKTNGALTVTQAASSLVLATNAASMMPGQALTLTAAAVDATPGSVGTPTGMVNFYNGATLLGTSPLTNGVATFTTSALLPGATYALTANYGGETNFIASTASSSVSITVSTLDFTLTLPTNLNLTVMPGGSVQSSFTVSPLYGSLAGPLTFTATGLPTGATINFSPSTISASDSTPQVVTMTIQMPAVSAQNQQRHPERSIPPIALGLLLLPLAGMRRVRKSALLRATLLLLLSIAGMGALTGCGTNSGFNATAPQNYTVTVTAKAGTVSHNFQINLNVQ